MAKEEEEQKITVGAFIEENHKLLSVLGIFTALTVFSKTLPIKLLGYALSFLFLGVVVLIWFELMERFPPKHGTQRLVWFENLLSFATLGIVLYWLLEFRTIWRQLLFLPIMLILGWILAAIIKKFNIFNLLFGEEPGDRKLLRYLFFYAVVGLILITSVLVAILVATPINELLDQLRSELDSAKF